MQEMGEVIVLLDFSCQICHILLTCMCLTIGYKLIVEDCF